MAVETKPAKKPCLQIAPCRRRLCRETWPLSSAPKESCWFEQEGAAGALALFLPQSCLTCEMVTIACRSRSTPDTHAPRLQLARAETELVVDLGAAEPEETASLIIAAQMCRFVLSSL
ncbi:hypothetical protein KIL84_008647 [Mauremys mutica]|uniref:Uncharacterized protein n=1 Tax=Mauremys mutica TaxID=74926 RepID=A0A9D3X846_9SAUR|nr:hypothetical protein KIL84_008647 [Mauremys mutica]